ncbi:MAG: hypothetical protein A3K19_10795 [Lentisphaerae bacterium RIFOXYB12_FULL_65_16]|nr:MAG: hypothetical protein A3K18_28520 [Lentisphaerae bacterium RIFOXYA12_64_32]OGV87874.1 MAG: hypothetical protein A3K19_10795 [Lentisphaerae bacterium RIFOXYB12_FULL_65_16]
MRPYPHLITCLPLASALLAAGCARREPPLTAPPPPAVQAPAAKPAAPRPAEATVTVTPEETDEILANPGMGWETFHRTAKQDKTLPAWIPSTVHYARWGWGTLEPEPSKIDTTFMERVLKETREAGQKLAFRVMCYSSNRKEPYLPAWLEAAGGRILIANYDSTKDLPIPDFDDPATLSKHLDFIQRLGQLYDGNPDIDHIDIGSLGWWGEWHLSGCKTYKMPTLEHQQQVVDAYLAAFPRTPLIMLIGGGKSLSYATQRGAGWRADCLGDMGGFSKTWCHMCQGYPTWFREANLGDAWKTAPVAYESCWDARKWVEEGWSLRHIFNYALATHASYLNNKSAPLPPGDAVKPEIERFLRRFGYRLVLRELSHPSTVQLGAPLQLAMKWQNVGSAPCYRPYRVAYRFSNAAGWNAVCVGGVTVNRWLPGSVELFAESFLAAAPDLPPGDVVPVTDTVTLPADTPPGECQLAVGVVAESAETPVVRLGIKGRDSDGWYPLSTVRVGRR